MATAVWRDRSRTPGPKGKPEEWYCLQCQEHNFSRNETCRICGTPASQGVTLTDLPIENFLTGYPVEAHVMEQLTAMPRDQQILVMKVGTLKGAKDVNAVLIKRMVNAQKGIISGYGSGPKGAGKGWGGDMSTMLAMMASLASADWSSWENQESNDWNAAKGKVDDAWGSKGGGDVWGGGKGGGDVWGGVEAGGDVWGGGKGGGDVWGGGKGGGDAWGSKGGGDVWGSKGGGDAWVSKGGGDAWGSKGGGDAWGGKSAVKTPAWTEDRWSLGPEKGCGKSAVKTPGWTEDRWFLGPEKGCGKGDLFAMMMKGDWGMGSWSKGGKY